MNSQRGVGGIFIFVLAILTIVGVAGYYMVSQKEGKPSQPQHGSDQPSATASEQQETPRQSDKQDPTQTTTSEPTPQPEALPRQQDYQKIDSCRTINTAGDYSLSTDIVNTKPKPCIKIQNVSGVNLDCKNHVITSTNENYAVYIAGASNFKLNSCRLASRIDVPLEQSAEHMLRVENSEQGEIQNTTIGGNFATVSGSSFVTIQSNIFNNQLNIYKSDNITIQDNTFSSSESHNIALQDGNDNSLVANILDGESDGVFENKVGADDVIFFEDQDNLLVLDNTIQNAFECAIEFNRVSGTRIIGNRVVNTGLSFLCGWHYVSAKDLTVKENVVNRSPSLFWFFRERALRPDEQYVYFQGNTFENNKLSNPKVSTGFSRAGLMDFNRSIVPPQNYILGNNVLRNNDFTKSIGPLHIAPADLITDGGGNICAGVIEETRGGGSISFNCN